jgi:ATP-dependent Lon protease
MYTTQINTSNDIMPIIKKMKNICKSVERKSKDLKKSDERKYKKGKDSDSEGDNYKSSGSGSENDDIEDNGGKLDQQNFDMDEYRKMLGEMFPSKYMNKRIATLENNKKNKKSEESRGTVDENRKVTRSSTKASAASEQSKLKENKPTEKSKKKGSHNPPPTDDKAKDEYDTSSTSTNCSDDDYSDGSEDPYSAGFGEFAKEQLKSGKFNIVINLLNDKKNHGEHEDDDSEYDSEEEWDSDDDEYDSDEYDSDDYDSDDDEDDSEDDPDYHPDEDEEAVTGDIKYYKYKDNKTKSEKTSKNSRSSNNLRSVSDKKSSAQVNSTTTNDATTSNDTDSLETIQKIKSQMEDILKVNKNDSIARETLCIMVKKEKEYKEKEERKMKNQQKRHVKYFKKMLRKKNSTNDLKYFKDNLSTEEQTAVLKELEDLNKLTITDKPYRLSLLQSDIPQAFKAIALKKITNLRHMEPGAGEYYKIKNWVDTFMQIPFGKYSNLPLTISDGIEKCHDFMENAKSTLDGAVYGLNDAKMQIMQMLGQWISNPAAMGTAIAINGPMGTGKTSLVKEGISKILNREFAFIPLGGATDSSYLEGHSYTYEGSTWGKIVDILIRSKSMNPVIYFDELDKISETPKGEEIIGILTHLTDTTQNSQFHDKYFAEIDFDLSKCLFIFSYNDPLKVNPILLDRMYKIKTTGYQIKDKIVIANQYLIPKIRYEVNFKEGDIIIPDATLNYIIENYTEKEDGVRNLKRCIEIVYKKLNLYRLVKPGTTLFEKDTTLVVKFPFTVTDDIVNNLIKKDENSLNRAPFNMYL